MIKKFHPILWWLWNKTSTLNLGIYVVVLLEELDRSFKSSPPLEPNYLNPDPSKIPVSFCECWLMPHISQQHYIHVWTSELLFYLTLASILLQSTDCSTFHFHLLALGLTSRKITVPAFSRSFRWLILVSVENVIPEAVHHSISPTMTHDFFHQEIDLTVRSLSHDSKFTSLLQYLSLADSW